MYVSRPYRVGIIAALALLCMAPNPAAARTSEKSPKTPEIAGDIAAVALPAAGLIVSLAVGDRQGVKQLALACAADLAVGYGLKYAIGKSRPAGHEGPAFPSIHSAVAFAGASYIQRRYGWKFGAPAYALAVYVGWSRIGAGARKHDIWDVLAGAALGAGCGYLFTKPYRKRRTSFAVVPIGSVGECVGVRAALVF
ncbi:MAG: phosphatase PAP2 family protein [Alistipes ihumii]|uniref:phosphatase PAP2 family protein n=1 Tax=Alistipes ihumii TaxID=1470347 RepID=UPI00265ECA5E|nr:phosphatase PAP2 family protein [Alistipes ihumii]